jgi:hypothetical protein
VTAVTLTAGVSDLICMGRLVFHGSSRWTKVDHPSVFHIECSSAALPPGLEWAWMQNPQLDLENRLKPTEFCKPILLLVTKGSQFPPES